jgi:undecaprenyl-diphosphatase
LLRSENKDPGRLSAAIARKRPAYLDELLERLDMWEITFVQAQTITARDAGLQQLVIWLNHLGDGWVYPLVAALLLLAQGSKAFPALEAAVLGVMIAHSIYPLIKLYLARLRPIERNPRLETLATPLDRYSCPSGHTMTAIAAFVPIGIILPGSMPAFSVFWVLLAWARVAAGHHYPSDLVVGATLGVIVTLPVSYWLLF